MKEFPIFVCDSVGTRTQNPRLRRAMLYPVELRNLQIGCKGMKKKAYCQIFLTNYGSLFI